MANEHIIDHIIVGWASLIMHRPSCIDQLKLPIFNELLDMVLHGIVLVIPPHLEELHLDLGEFSLRVVNEGPHDIGELNLNVGPLSISIRSIEIFFDGL